MAKLEFFDGTDWQIIESSSPISIDLQGDVTGTYNNGIINTTLAKTLENPSGIWRFNLLNATISTQRIFSSFEYAFNALSSVGNTFSHIFKDLTESANDLSFDAVFTSGQEAFFDFKRGTTSLLKIKGGEIDFVSKKLINVANGTSNNDAINLSQLNQSIFNATATIPKQSCQCATTTSFINMYNVTSYTYNNGSSGIGATISLTLLTGTQIAIDGYVPRQGDRILVKNQSLEHNGIYILTTAPSASTVILTRATDYDYIGKITQNDYIDIIFGTINGATRFNQTYFAPITVGSSYISFTRINPKDCLLRTNNLSDLSNVVDARWNLNVYSLANSTSNGLTLSVNTTTMVATFGLNSELNTLANLNTTGILARTGTGTYATRSLAAGTGITITNGNGVSGNPTLSVNQSALSLNSIGVTGDINLNTYNLYTTGYLGAMGTLYGNNLASYNTSTINVLSQLVFTGSAASYRPILVNNTNTASTASEIIFQENGVNTFGVGYNNNSGEGYLWTYNASNIKFGVNGSTILTLNSTGATFNGTFNAQTGALKANNLLVHNNSAIVCDPLAVTGGYFPYNGSYGWLNSAGNIGTASGSYSYSINATYRIKASEFNAVSSIKKKDILARGIEIEQEVIDVIKKTEFFKYKYKDQITEKGIRYGIIAEELAKTLPDYIDYNNMEYIPNIMQVGTIKKINNTEYQYLIKLKEEVDKSIKINKLKIINNKNKMIEVDILDIIDIKTLKIISKEDLPDKVFVYGTYEECPSVATKVTELALIAIKNILTRIEQLEKRSI